MQAFRACRSSSPSLAKRPRFSFRQQDIRLINTWGDPFSYFSFAMAPSTQFAERSANRALIYATTKTWARLSDQFSCDLSITLRAAMPKHTTYPYQHQQTKLIDHGITATLRGHAGRIMVEYDTTATRPDVWVGCLRTFLRIFLVSSVQMGGKERDGRLSEANGKNGWMGKAKGSTFAAWKRFKGNRRPSRDMANAAWAGQGGLSRAELSFF